MIDFNDIDIEEHEEGYIIFSNNILESFLIDNGLKDRYIYNCRNISLNRLFFHRGWNSLETLCDDLNPYEYISSAFDFSGDVEERWYLVDIKWREHILEKVGVTIGDIDFDEFDAWEDELISGSTF